MISLTQNIVLLKYFPYFWKYKHVFKHEITTWHYVRKQGVTLLPFSFRCDSNDVAFNFRPFFSDLRSSTFCQHTLSCYNEGKCKIIRYTKHKIKLKRVCHHCNKSSWLTWHITNSDDNITPHTQVNYPLNNNH